MDPTTEGASTWDADMPQIVNCLNRKAAWHPATGCRSARRVPGIIHPLLSRNTIDSNPLPAITEKPGPASQHLGVAERSSADSGCRRIGTFIIELMIEISVTHCQAHCTNVNPYKVLNLSKRCAVDSHSHENFLDRSQISHRNARDTDIATRSANHLSEPGCDAGSVASPVSFSCSSRRVSCRYQSFTFKLAR